MTKQETIQVLQSIEDRATDFPYMTACDWVAIAAAKRHLQEEPVSEELEEASRSYSDNIDNICGSIGEQVRNSFKTGAKWQKEHLWKPADGDDLPETDKEVIALLNNGKIVFAHRPYKGKYIGKNLTTGNIETFENKTYDKCGWNQPYVKWWLDCEWPNKEELV